MTLLKTGLKAVTDDLITFDLLSHTFEGSRNIELTQFVTRVGGEESDNLDSFSDIYWLDNLISQVILALTTSLRSCKDAKDEQCQQCLVSQKGPAITPQNNYASFYMMWNREAAEQTEVGKKIGMHYYICFSLCL